MVRYKEWWNIDLYCIVWEKNQYKLKKKVRCMHLHICETSDKIAKNTNQKAAKNSKYSQARLYTTLTDSI